MERIVKEDNQFQRKELPEEEAIKLFKELGEDYKIELINDLPEDAKISIYTDGGFTDLCAGPHLPSTGHVKAFKLLNVAGLTGEVTQTTKCFKEYTEHLSLKE